MKPHKILKSFPGSQTGNDHHHFEAGTIASLSDDLAAIAVKEGWAEPHVEEQKAVEEAPANKAINSAPSNKRRK